jgi:hypothetical protein
VEDFRAETEKTSDKPAPFCHGTHEGYVRRAQGQFGEELYWIDLGEFDHQSK